MTGPYVFLSYLPEDEDLIAPVLRQIKSAGLEVADRTGLTATDAESLISRARAFVACFSDRGHVESDVRFALSRPQAIEQRAWMTAVRLTRCDIPPLLIGGERPLRDCIVDVDQIAARLTVTPAAAIKAKVAVEEAYASEADWCPVEVEDHARIPIDSSIEVKKAVVDKNFKIVGVKTTSGTK